MQAAYRSLKKTFNIKEIIIGYPGIESIFDAFGIVADCIEQIEAALWTTLHIARPTIYSILQKLEYIVHGKQVWGGEGKAWAHPQFTLATE